jgi:8-oxo-dGTP diphosphatase/2-hydroxy-dATP diphosphatase
VSGTLLTCIIYTPTNFEITRTEEMRPAWFSTTAALSLKPPAEGNVSDNATLSHQLDSHTLAASDDHLPALPYDLMWQDDRWWFPLLIQGRRFVGRADFVKDTSAPTGFLMHRSWFAATEVELQQGTL